MLRAQEPVVFHYNFSLEENYSYLHKLNNFEIQFVNSLGTVLSARDLIKEDFKEDDYGYCLLSDTFDVNLLHNENYFIKIKYTLRSSYTDSAIFSFDFPNHAQKMSFEIFFDQSVLVKIDTLRIGDNKYPDNSYIIDLDPKPAIIIKYITESSIELLPTWFAYGRLNTRPCYILSNRASETIKTAGRGFRNYFSGHLQILDSLNSYKDFFLGFQCGNVSGKDTLAPGETDYIVEGFTIGDPQKLKEGFYKYSVGYLDSEGEIKNAETYFKVIYSK